MIIILWTILAVVLSAVLYRLGGMGDGGRKRFPKLPKWIFNTKSRDLGCAAVCLLWMVLCFPAVAWWVHALSFGLMFGSLTTYWDKLFKYDNFWFHGLMIGVAYFPYAIVTGSWLGFVLRALCNLILVGIISELSGDDDTEELGRGASFAVTLPFMLF